MPPSVISRVVPTPNGRGEVQRAAVITGDHDTSASSATSASHTRSTGAGMSTIWV